jgi:hypothetical protein
VGVERIALQADFVDLEPAGTVRLDKDQIRAQRGALGVVIERLQILVLGDDVNAAQPRGVDAFPRPGQPSKSLISS